MAVGISSSCYYPENTEDAVRHLAQAGVRHIEIFFNARCETRGPILREICHIVRSEGIQVCAVHPYFTFAESYMLFSSYARRFDDGIELYKELCETCAELNSDILVMHGEKEKFLLEESEYLDRFSKVEFLCREAGVRLTQENVVRFRSQSVDFLKRMRSALGDQFRLTLDIKQAVRSGVNPLALAEEFLPNIAHVHLSDHGALGDCLLPGEGNFNFKALFDLLSQGGYSGNCVLELYRPAYESEKDLLNSYKNLLKTIAK